MARFEIVIVAVSVLSFTTGFTSKLRREPSHQKPAVIDNQSEFNVTSPITDCVCGVFLSSQMVKNGLASSAEIPTITIEVENPVTCGSLSATSDCNNKCVEEMMKYVPTAAKMICSAVDRDVYKEKASLFIDVCNEGWRRTRISTSKIICCKDSLDYKCPV